MKNYRWYVAAILFLFLLLHQVDKLMIGMLTTAIMEDFQINEAQMGAVSSLAIFVAAVLYPIWGYLYDRYTRARLLALASLIWGGTTWLNALAPFLAGVIAMHASLQTAIVTISISTWFMCAVLFFATAYVVPQDIEKLRQIMAQRVKELEGDVA